MRASLRFHLAIAAAKVTSFALKLAGRTGEHLPGVVAHAIDPKILDHIPKPARVVFISGTNGKTTTTNLLSDVLADNGVAHISNRSGANIVNGIETAFLKNATLTGRQRIPVAIMELDEVSYRTVMPYVEPEISLVTNLYGDTFTRSADPAYIFDIMSTLTPAGSKVVLNADDLISCRIAPQAADKVYYSIAQLPDDTDGPQGIVCDLTACPDCGGALEYDWCHLRHLGRAHCTACGLTNPEPDYLVTRIDRDAHTFTVSERCRPDAPEYEYHFGAYSVANIYNLLCVVVAAREFGLTPQQIARSLERLSLPEQRFVEREVAGKRIVTIASKGENATANSVAFDAIRKEPGAKDVVIMISDNHMAEVPEDTEYIGWYWQADFEYFKDPCIRHLFVYGCTADDILLRMRMAGIDPSIISIVDNPMEIVDLVDFDEVDGVFFAHGTTTVEIAHGVADKLVEKAQGAELSASADRVAADAAAEAVRGTAGCAATEPDHAESDACEGASDVVIELLYPEYGNQGGDNGNAMILRQSLPDATFIETRYGDEPYFAHGVPSLIVMSSMPEMQQENVIKALMPYRDRLAELVEAGVPMFFSGTAGEVLGKEIVNPDGSAVEALGILDMVTRRCEPQRFRDVNLGVFDPGDGMKPFEVVGYKVQFTQMEGDNAGCCFCENEIGFGLNEHTKLEGFRKNNLIATWMLGPVLPLNPDLTAWLLKQATGDSCRPAYEKESRACYERRLTEFRIPGVGMHV